jgi:hypothetical protein
MGPLSEDRRRKKTRSSLSRRSRIPVVSAQTTELTVPAAEDGKEAIQGILPKELSADDQEMLLEEQSIDTAIWRRRVAWEKEREAKERQEAYYWALVDLLSRTVYSS